MVSIQSIKGMKRAELQALCKTNKLKANGKTEELMQNLIDYYKSDISASNASSTVPGTSTKVTKKPLSSQPHTIKKKPSVKPVASTFLSTPQKSGEDDEDDDDEMRLQTPVAMRVKKTAHNPLLRQALVSSNAFTPARVAPATLARPKSTIQAEASFATSPATKKIITTLLSTVTTLQAELASTRSQLARIESSAQTLQNPSTPPTKRASIIKLIDERVEAHRREMDRTIDARFDAASKQLDELRQMIPLAVSEQERESIRKLEKTVDEEMRSTRLWQEEMKGEFSALREEVVANVSGCSVREPAEDGLWSPSELVVDEEIDSPVRAVASPIQLAVSPPLLAALPEVAQSPAVHVDAPTARIASPSEPIPASPTLSDAPPTKTLASFSDSSPSGSPRPRPSLRGLARSPSKRLSTLPSTSNEPAFALPAEPALALPAHMLSHISPVKNGSSPRRRSSSPRQSLINTPIAVTNPIAMSPAPSVVRSIGKRSRRDSDMSNVSNDNSFVFEAVSMSAKRNEMTSRGDTGKSGNHSRTGRARKRMRVDAGDGDEGLEMERERVFQDERSSEAEDEHNYEDNDEDEEVEGDDSSESSEELEGSLLRPMERDEDDIPEGSSPSKVETPQRDFVVSTKTGEDSIPTSPIQNPFLVSFPKSQSVNSFTSPSGSRHTFSLPTVSPFGAKSPARSHIARALGSTPNRRISAFNKPGLFSDASNRKTSLVVPPTPPASKTLYGTERFGDEAEEEGASLRFGDVAGMI